MTIRKDYVMIRDTGSNPDNDICLDANNPRLEKYVTCEDANDNPDDDVTRLDADSPKDIEAGVRSADDNSRQLRMPVHLLNVRLPLVNEQQLRGHGGLFPTLPAASLAVPLQGEVPQGQLVVRARRSEDGGVRGVPLHGSDRGRVVFEHSHRAPVLQQAILSICT